MTKELLDRTPPNDQQAERGVLGSILILPDVIDDVANILTAADFHDDANATFYARLAAMHTAGEAIDVTVLVDRLKAAGEFERIGGAAYLAKITSSVVNAAHVIHYAKIVRRKAEHRAIINASTEALRQAYNEERDPPEIRQTLIEQLDGDAERGHEVATAAKVATETVAEIKRRHEHGQPIGLATGFSDIDAKTGGFHSGELTILAARPGMGKTASALQMAVHQAKRANVLFISMEMSDTELMTRILCTEVGVDHQRIRGNTLDDTNIGQLEIGAKRIGETGLFILDPPSMTVADIRTEARRLRKRHGLALLVVDYLTRLAPANPRLKRHEQVGQMSGDLKRLARELNIPVVCLAQLNRQAEASGSHRPQLSHLRDSGDIEQDADTVWFLHRPEVYKPDDGDLKGKAEFIIAKNRNGPVGTFDLQWIPETTEFRTLAPAYRDWGEAYHEVKVHDFGEYGDIPERKDFA